jgi:hypothetical protein
MVVQLAYGMKLNAALPSNISQFHDCQHDEHLTQPLGCLISQKGAHHFIHVHWLHYIHSHTCQLQTVEYLAAGNVSNINFI